MKDVRITSRSTQIFCHYAFIKWVYYEFIKKKERRHTSSFCGHTVLFGVPLRLASGAWNCRSHLECTPCRKTQVLQSVSVKPVKSSLKGEACKIFFVKIWGIVMKRATIVSSIPFFFVLRSSFCWFSHLPHFILSTTGLSEIGDRRELSMDGLSIKPAVIQVNHRFLCIFLTAELHTHTRGFWLFLGRCF